MIEKSEKTLSLEQTLAKQVIGLGMRVHRALGCGFLESVYANALGIELQRAGIFHEREKVFPVYYDGTQVGVFQADLVVENCMIVELKAVEALAVAHSIQLVNYLRRREVDFGLLLNFGARSLDFKTKTRVYGKQPAPPNLHS